ncbi:Transcription initiation factor TFIID subunit [Dirofilaria immitis]
MPHNTSLSIFAPELSGYYISRIDEKSMISHCNDQSTEHIGKQLRRFRLDDGFQSFWRHCQAEDTIMPRSSQYFAYAKNGQRKMGSRTTIRSYPTYTENSFGKSMLEYLRTDSFPVLNFKQSFSTLRRFKRRNLDVYHLLLH